MEGADQSAGRRRLLRVGVMAPGHVLARWQRAVLEELLAGGDAELVVLVVDEGSAPARRSGLVDRRLLWRLYNNVWVRRHARSIARVDCADLLDTLPRIRVEPLRVGRYAQHFPAEAIDELRRLDLDVLLRFAFGILGGAVLEVARHGVWSYHHDDERVIRGGPPSFWEVADGQATTGVLLQRLTDRLDAGIPLGRATFGTVGHSYPRNRDRASMGAAVLVAQAAREVRHGRLDPVAQPVSQTSAPIRRVPTNRQMLAFLRRHAARILTAQARGIVVGHRWTVGLAAGVPDLAVRTPVEWLPERPGGYLADPFPAERDGVTAVLVEEFDERSAMGVISAIRRDGGGWTVSSGVLHTGVHASYPFLLEYDGELLCIPETARAGRVEAWRCVRFPERWERHATLLDDVPVLDPTIVEWAGRWWMFGTRRDRDPNAELWLWHAATPLGPWTAHPASPVKIDVRSSRPAGTPFVRDGVLYRPAQDCSHGYGGAVVVNRVLQLDGTTFCEEAVGRFIVGDGRYTAGAHTLAQRDGLVAVDARRRVLDVNRSRRELLARLHPRDG